MNRPSAPPRLTPVRINDLFIDHLDALLARRGYSRARLLEEMRPHGVHNASALQRLMAGTRVAVPWDFVVGLTEVFGIPVDYFRDGLERPPTADGRDEVDYANALMTATSGIVNPQYLIASRFPTFAVLTDALARYANALMHGNHPAVAARQNALAGLIRENYKRYSPAAKSRVVNYVGREAFDSLFAPAAPLERGVRMAFRRDLETAVRNPRMFQMYVVDDVVIGNTNTRLTAAGKITSDRKVETPGVSWEHEAESIKETEKWIGRVIHDGWPIRVDAAYIADVWRRLNGSRG